MITNEKTTLQDVAHRLLTKRKSLKRSRRSFKGMCKKTIKKMEEGDDNYKLSSLVRYLNFLKMEIILQANNTSTKLVNRGYIDMYWNLMKLDMQLHNHLFDHCKDVVQFLNYCNLIGIEIIFRKKED